MRSPLYKTFREPKGDFLFGGLNSVRAVAEVAANVNAEVTTDSAKGRISGLSSTEHLPAFYNCVLSLPYHAANGTGVHVGDKAREEALAGKVSVVLLKKLF